MVTPKPTVLLLDFAPETNAGDYAIQRGLLNLIEAHRPAVRLVVSVTLGSNQMDRLNADFPRLLSEADVEVIPMVRRTHFQDRGGVGRLASEAANALSLVVGSLWLMVARRWRTAARRLLGSRQRAALAEIERADLIIWRGKNLRGRPNRILELFRIHTRLFMPLVCQAFGKRVVCVGLSVWPVRGRIARRLVRSVLMKCAFVGVREAESLEQVRQLLDGDARTFGAAPDLSLAWLAVKPAKSPVQPVGERISVALTLMDWPEFGREARNRYISSIARYLEALDCRHDLNARIIPQVTKAWERTATINHRLLASLTEETRRSVTTVEPVESPRGLLAEYRNADVLLATRMHSAIFALAVGTPVIVIAYDVGPKWSVLTELGLSELIIRYDEVTLEALLSRHQLLLDSGQQIVDAARNSLAEQARTLVDSPWIDEVRSLTGP